MVTSKTSNPSKCNIKVNGTVLKQVDKFKYLGTIITSDGRCVTEIKSRTAQAKAAFQKMRNILCNNSLSIEVRKNILKCYIEPILLYGSEAWTIDNIARKHLEATEMWFYRRMLKISWTAKTSNTIILHLVNSNRELINCIRRRQSQFLGHVMRRGGLENIVTTGKIEGKRDRGRQREKMLDGLKAWHDAESSETIFKCITNRGLWRDMIAYAGRHGTNE